MPQPARARAPLHRLGHPVLSRAPPPALAIASYRWSRRRAARRAQVANIREAIRSLKDAKVRPLTPEPKIGAHGKPVVFLHPKDCNGVLVELEEA